jgi:hypothetical protein
VLPDPEELGKNGGTACQAQPGTAEFIIEVEKRRSIKVILRFIIAVAPLSSLYTSWRVLMQVFGSNKLVGLVLVTLGGVCFSLSAPAINLAINDQWHCLKRKGTPHLVVYTVFITTEYVCSIG